jgi:hypothetical protein
MMGRLRRFGDYRFIGRRDQMRVYDCDDPEQFQALEQAVSEFRLDIRNLLSSFAPDTLAEARNRGFRRVESKVSESDRG